MSSPVWGSSKGVSASDIGALAGEYLCLGIWAESGLRIASF